MLFRSRPGDGERSGSGACNGAVALGPALASVGASGVAARGCAQGSVAQEKKRLHINPEQDMLIATFGVPVTMYHNVPVILLPLVLLASLRSVFRCSASLRIRSRLCVAPLATLATTTRHRMDPTKG